MDSPNNNDDATILWDLNDDCLLEILQYITVHETFALIGRLGSRFDDIAYKRIGQLKSLHINPVEPPQFNTWQLEIIGKNLKNLCISAGYSLPSHLTLYYLQPISGQSSLQRLALNYVKFDRDYQKCVMNIASTLQVLDLCYCHLNDNLLEPILKECSNLKSLAVFGNVNLKCESLQSLRSRVLKELKVEKNCECKIAIESFKAANPSVTVTVYALGHLGHLSSKSYDDIMFRKP